MCNTSQFLNRVKTEFAEREFDPQETLKWLSINKVMLWSWGFEKPTAISSFGLAFKVNGHHHKGWVLITLAYNDTYTLRFFSQNFEETKPKQTNVYCDELQERVDIAVERIEAYGR